MEVQTQATIPTLMSSNRPVASQMSARCSSQKKRAHAEEDASEGSAVDESEEDLEDPEEEATADATSPRPTAAVKVPREILADGTRTRAMGLGFHPADGSGQCQCHHRRTPIHSPV